MKRSMILIIVLSFVGSLLAENIEVDTWSMQGRWEIKTQVRVYVADFTNDGNVFLREKRANGQEIFKLVGKYRVYQDVLKFNIYNDIFFAEVMGNEIELGLFNGTSILEFYHEIGEQAYYSRTSQLFSMVRLPEHGH